MKILHTLLLCFMISLFFACQEAKDNQLHLNCDVLNQLVESDQELRNTSLRSPFFNALDSLIKATGHEPGLDDIDSSIEYGGRTFDDWWQEAKLHEKPLTLKQQKVRDSLWVIQRSIDSLNSLHLINLIETFGMDSLDHVNNVCDIHSLIIFVHTPAGLMDRVGALVEANKDKIGPERYNHIGWHLNGRERR